jgi:hypothetical protein
MGEGTSAPSSETTADTTRERVFPSPWTWVRINVQELALAVGWSGASCLLIATGAIAVIVASGWLSIAAWSPAPNEPGIVWWPGHGFDVPLAPAWLAYVLAFYAAGWLLSRVASKRWLRVWAIAGTVTGVILLVAVGRADRVDLATDRAEVEARHLLATEPSSTVDERRLEADLRAAGEVSSTDADDVLAGERADEERSGADEPVEVVARVANVPSSLIRDLCDLAGMDAASCVNQQGIVMDRLPIELVSAPLACLPGWTYAAVQRWAADASLDRRTETLGAAARCEIAAVTAEEAAVPSEGASPPDEMIADEVAALDEALAVQRTEIDAFDALEGGADGVLAWISGSTRFAVFRFSAVAWLALLVVTLVWYRELEIRAGRHRLGPVEIIYEPHRVAGSESPPKHANNGSKATDQESAAGTVAGSTGEAVFRTAVVRNVPEPGAVPGAHALAPVGDLVAESEIPHRRWISGALEAVRMILATRSGFTVVYTSHETSDGSVVFVRLRDMRTGNQLASMSFTHERLESASRLAGYWVAGWIISRSRYVPTWAQWSEHDARAFHSLRWVQGDHLPLLQQGTANPGAIDASSVNSLILAQRAYAYQVCTEPEQAPKHFNALEDFARAAHRRRRYPVARYRRGAALSALMDPGVDLLDAFEPPPGESGPPSRSRLRYLFGDLVLPKRSPHQHQLEEWIDSLCGDPPTVPAPMRTAMLGRIAHWAAENRAEVRWGWLARLRPAERYFWRDFRQGRLNRDWLRLIDASLCITAERLRQCQDLTRVERLRLKWMRWRVERRARSPQAHWQISYNLACHYSLRSVQPATEQGENAAALRKTACDWLERCLDRPYSGQLVREWIDHDPDLEPLANEEDYQRWCRRVPRMPIVLRNGDVGERVRKLQADLGSVFCPGLDADGHYGERTAECVKKFQTDQGLAADGVAGPRTLEAIDRERRARTGSTPPREPAASTAA